MTGTTGTTLSASTADTSPLTGWDRARWAALADDMLLAVRPFASPRHALILLPGAPGGYGSAVDALEGYARTFLLAGFRLAGEHGEDPLGLAERYADGLAAGTDPTSPERWVRLDEHPQAKVEAASLALVLDMTRPWLWDRLSPVVQEQVVDYLSHAVGDQTYPRINWVWFRLVVQTFLRSVGGPWSATDAAEDLATHDGFDRGDGWLADGQERAFDHYGGFALHLFPVLWSRMSGAADLADGRQARDRAALGRYLSDAVRLVGADGSPLVQGRSLTYRFATAAPFWAGLVAGVKDVPAGVLRRAASGVLAHFVDNGAIDERGLLGLGWHRSWPQIAQSYSGPGSPYWASKGMLGLSLPAEHPAWTAVELPLPVEVQDQAWLVRPAGWLVSGTRDDGVVRVVNHGTDHAVEGEDVADSPLYARLGYSTVTAPLLDDEAWAAPLEQSVCLLDDRGRPSHRAGMRTSHLELVDDGGTQVAVGASAGRHRWLDQAVDQPRHGSGLRGATSEAGAITVVSLLRGAHEIRLVRVDGSTTDPAPARLRVGGWPVAGGRVTDRVSDDRSSATCTSDGPGAAVSGTITTLGPAGEVGVTRRPDAGPLGSETAVGHVTWPVEVGTWRAVLVSLHGGRRALTGPRSTHVSVDDRADDGIDVEADWPDSARTRLRVPLDHPGPAPLPPGDQTEPNDGLDR